MRYDEGEMILVRDREMVGLPMRIYMFLCIQMTYENTVLTTQDEIAEITGAYKPNISRAITRLERKGIIARLHGTKRAYAFMVNPFYAWKGRNEHIGRAQRKFDALRRKFTVVNGTREARPTA